MYLSLAFFVVFSQAFVGHATSFHGYSFVPAKEGEGGPGRVNAHFRHAYATAKQRTKKDVLRDPLLIANFYQNTLTLLVPNQAVQVTRFSIQGSRRGFADSGTSFRSQHPLFSPFIHELKTVAHVPVALLLKMNASIPWKEASPLGREQVEFLNNIRMDITTLSQPDFHNEIQTIPSFLRDDVLGIGELYRALVSSIVTWLDLVLGVGAIEPSSWKAFQKSSFDLVDKLTSMTAVFIVYQLHQRFRQWTMSSNLNLHSARVVVMTPHMATTGTIRVHQRCILLVLSYVY